MSTPESASFDPLALRAPTKQTPFELVSKYAPKGSQPEAIQALSRAVKEGVPHQVLLGITGSGKTFTAANLIEKTQKPTLILAHNKTLAAQLYTEFKALFPKNAVEYFVSYYDYYQPEAYVASTDTYIEKDSNINEQIDRMRHAATFALLSRRDVIIVASVSCIFGIGSRAAYSGMVASIEVDQELDRDDLLRRLIAMRYERNDLDFHRATFRVRGDVVEIFPAYEEQKAYRIEFFGDTVESIITIDALRGTTLEKPNAVTIFPASHYVTPQEQLKRAVTTIQAELAQRLVQLRDENKLVEAQRLEQRTMYDIEMLEEIGHCSGIENYSRHLSGAAPGEPPPTLVDYFPKDHLLIVDESHQTVPQVRAMYKGDRQRKQNLVDFGFRLPSALDNRPLKFDEWESRVRQAIFVSATPGEYELELTQGEVVEQIIRPTGLLDPEIDVRPVANQIDDLLDEAKKRIEKGQRVLITTLTKRMAEDLTEYYADLGLKVRYIHADVDTLERIEILRDLRQGLFDILVGINLLREGLDLPEVSLVAILDADKEGFLRNRRSLIQTCGRAARNVEGQVIMYADRITQSMQETIDETNRRRKIQSEYNKLHNIVPKSTTAPLSPVEADKKSAGAPMADRQTLKRKAAELGFVEPADRSLRGKELNEKILELQKEMRNLAKELRFEEAAAVRDRLQTLSAQQLEYA